ncbi:hypothetical protein AWB94_00060 [Mycolicibacterium canariasense]|nr:hypothetical protein AWB94_00060 [Mycolicibacterium canariasense]
MAWRRYLSFSTLFGPEGVKLGNGFTVLSDDEMFSRCNARKNLVQIDPDVPHSDRVRLHK